MPVFVDPEHIPHIRSDIKENAPKVKFWRDVLTGKLSDVFYKSITNPAAVKDDNYLKRLKPFESDDTFSRRAMYAEDNKWSNKVIDSYGGFYTNANIEIESGLSENMDKVFQENIDGQGSGAIHYSSQVFAELLSMGQVFPWVDVMTDDNGQPLMPFTRLLPREAIMDYELNPAGHFEWVKFVISVPKLEGIKRENVKQIWIVDDTSYRIYEENQNKWVLVDERPQELPEIPILYGTYSNSIPIIDNIAKMQLDQMNLSSEMRNTIAIQSLNLLQMSQTMFEKFSVASAVSAIIYPDGAADRANWIAPPASTMDAAFKYLELRDKEIKNMANLARRDTRQVESAESKAFDWFETEAVLQKTSEEIEDIFTALIKIYGLFENKIIETPIFKIDEEFVSEATSKQLDDLLKAQLIINGSDPISEAEIIKKARDMTLELTPEQVDESNDNIEESQVKEEEPDTTLTIEEQSDENIPE